MRIKLLWICEIMNSFRNSLNQNSHSNCELEFWQPDIILIVIKLSKISTYSLELKRKSEKLKRKREKLKRKREKLKKKRGKKGRDKTGKARMR